MIMLKCHNLYPKIISEIIKYRSMNSPGFIVFSRSSEKNTLNSKLSNINFWVMSKIFIPNSEFNFENMASERMMQGFIPLRFQKAGRVWCGSARETL